MKHYYLLSYSIFLLIPHVFHTAETSNNTVTISKFSELVHERTYYLSRLEKSINLFMYLQKNKPEFCIACDFISPFKKQSHFNHPVIKKTVSAMDKSQSLKPLFNLWKQLRTYKMIKDELLIREFTKLTLAISTKLALPCPYAQGKNSHYTHGETILLHEGNNYTEVVTKRDYYSQRLAGAIELLLRLRCKKKNLFEPCTTSAKNGVNALFANRITFTHKQIQCCIAKIRETQSLRPLQELALEFKKYKFIQDDVFTKEFLILLFITYKNIIIHNLNKDQLAKNKPTLETIAQLYGVIESLPLEEILDAIDMINEGLPALLEQYEFTSDMSWKKWIKKYWWVPPLVITKTSLVLYLRYKLKDLSVSIVNKNQDQKPEESKAAAEPKNETTSSKNTPENQTVSPEQLDNSAEPIV